MSIYYVYAYIRESTGEPYYIGKGKNKRAYDKHWFPIPSDKNRIVFLATGLEEKVAFALEMEYVKKYGRIDIGTGILFNRSPGGDGFKGEYSKASRRKQTESWKRKKEKALAHYNEQFKYVPASWDGTSTFR